MIIPWVQIKWISDEVGYGLIAAQDIPKGTITFVQDGLDIVIPNEELEKIPSSLRVHVEKYSYEDYLGNRIISWDMGKYMNHSDNANTLTTGYGFEVAIRDIKKGEEITDDYRIFSTHHDTTFSIKDFNSLEHFQIWPDELLENWDNRVKETLSSIGKVEQPLKEFLNMELWEEITSKNAIKTYKSVADSLPLTYKVRSNGLVKHF
ncbi:MAG: SET domain-containing protein [Bdellovibrionales bacterium]|nr:SET domain-containing protein [Bdellovibrionales bacterium]